MHRRTADRASGAIPRRGRARRALIGWTVTTLLAATASGQTETCVPYIETPPGSGYARLRPHATALLDCAVDEPTYRRLVAAWLAARDPEAPTLTSFALGRAVHYPWLSRLLADLALAQPDWAGRVAAARPGTRDRLASAVFADPGLLQRLGAPFAASGYRARRVVYEKVLFGRADRYATDPGGGDTWVPYDAQLWIELEPQVR